MGGLYQYLERYGGHLTEELVTSNFKCKWSADEVKKSIQDRVYYNVTESTIGDIVFLVNMFSKYASKRKCILYALAIIGNYDKRGYAFNTFLDYIDNSNIKVDFTKYI